MIPTNIDYLDRLNPSAVKLRDHTTIDSVLSGMTIVGAEVVGFGLPHPDGLVLYAHDQEGRLHMIDIEAVMCSVSDPGAGEGIDILMCELEEAKAYG